MSTLDINKKKNEIQLGKAVLAYLILAVLTVVIDKVYGVFGHGVKSAAMTWMFLYPLLGGALFYFIIHLLIPNITKITGFRVSFNMYNSGVATLTIASLLKGIFEIAGTDSVYLIYYYITGGTLMAVGLIIMLIMALSNKN